MSGPGRHRQRPERLQPHAVLLGKVTALLEGVKSGQAPEWLLGDQIGDRWITVQVRCG